MIPYIKKSSEHTITRTSANTKANTPAAAENAGNTVVSNQSMMTPNSTISQNGDDTNNQAVFINYLKSCKPLTYDTTPQIFSASQSIMTSPVITSENEGVVAERKSNLRASEDVRLNGQ